MFLAFVLITYVASLQVVYLQWNENDCDANGEEPFLIGDLNVEYDAPYSDGGCVTYGPQDGSSFQWVCEVNQKGNQEVHPEWFWFNDDCAGQPNYQGWPIFPIEGICVNGLYGHSHNVACDYKIPGKKKYAHFTVYNDTLASDCPAGNIIWNVYYRMDTCVHYTYGNWNSYFKLEYLGKDNELRLNAYGEDACTGTVDPTVIDIPLGECQTARRSVESVMGAPFKFEGFSGASTIIVNMLLLVCLLFLVF